MPNMDGTGPLGKGPRTGKGMGRCKKRKKADKYYSESEQGRGADEGRGTGKSRGVGQGRGAGQGRGYL